MSTPEETLNSESNDIAGNRVAGPLGNTATQANGPVVGQPGGVGNPHPAADSAAAPPASESPASGHQAIESAALPSDPTHDQPATYGGNFGNSTQPAAHDRARYDNQASDANRGEFGTQGTQGTTHGGYGNQHRDHITEHQGPADKKYYGEGNVRPGSGDHNAYLAYDGRDERPDVLPSPADRAVADTPPAGAVAPAPPAPALDGRQNPLDNRNRPDRADEVAAFQNDNGAAQAQGSAYAADYGHTSGVGLPRTAAPAGPQAPPVVPGRNQAEDDHSMRGGYEPQTAPEPAHAPAGGAPAPSGPAAPHAPQGEGYGYGHERNEQPKKPDMQTGATRQGTTPGTDLARHGGDTGTGYGSKGGSYDDQNPGAHPEGLDQHTTQAQNAANGPGTRAEHRPVDGNDESYGPAPRRNEGRDGEG